MSLLDKLVEERAVKFDELRDMPKLLEADGRDDFTEDEQSKFDGLEADVRKLDERIKRLQAIDDLEGLARSGVNRRSLPEDPIADPIQRSEPKAKKAVIEIPSNVRRKSGMLAFTRDRFPNDNQERAYRFGQAVLASVGNQRSIKWLRDHGIEFRGFNDAEKRVHSEGINWQGGYFVFDEIDNDMLILRESFGVARQFLRTVSMSSDVRTRTKWSSGLTAYYVGETDAITESTTATKAVKLVAAKIGAIATVTSELNEDAVIDIGDFVANEMAYAFASAEDAAAFYGDGTSTYGGFQGVVPAITNTGTACIHTQTTAGNPETALTLGDFGLTLAKLPAYAMTPNLRWVMSSQFFWGAVARLIYASGGVTTQELAGTLQPSLMGIPVLFSQKFPTAYNVAAGDQVVCIVGDGNQTGDFGDRRGIQISMSDSATIGSTNVFASDEMAVRGTARFAVNIHSVGDSSTPEAVAALKTDVA